MARKRLTFLALAACAALLLGLASPRSAEANLGSVADGWNNDQIAWLEYEDGLVAARRTGRPVFLVVHTTWCAHCRQYQKLFFDPRVVELARSYVMVMLDRDLDKDLNARIGPAGQTYVPRTVILRPDGSVRTDIVGSRRDYPNFISYGGPDELLRIMRQGLAG